MTRVLTDTQAQDVAFGDRQSEDRLLGNDQGRILAKTLNATNVLGANFVMCKKPLRTTSGRKCECRRLRVVHKRSFQYRSPSLSDAQVGARIGEVRKCDFEKLFRHKSLRQRNQNRCVLGSEGKDRDAGTIRYPNCATLAVAPRNVCRALHGREYTRTQCHSPHCRAPYGADMISPYQRLVLYTRTKRPQECVRRELDVVEGRDRMINGWRAFSRRHQSTKMINRSEILHGCGPYLAVIPGIIFLPSLNGKTKGRMPKSWPLTISFAKTTPTAGTPQGLVGGIILFIKF